jgi:hypothetical protein
VDIQVLSNGIHILGRFPVTQRDPMDEEQMTLRDAYDKLPYSLKRICGDVKFLMDNRDILMSHISTANIPLFGASDASLKDGRASHAWVVSTGTATDLCSSVMHLSGSGMVDGYHSNLSSTRAELTGLTALSIIIRLLSDFHSSSPHVIFSCDSQGAISKAQSFSTNRI